MRRIRKVAVLGSGIMGTGIACQLANAGLEVLMLDILPPDLEEAQAAVPAARNRIANSALEAAKKHKPAPLYDAAFASRIRIGNLEDDLPQMASCDWIIEVIVERLDIKQALFEKVEMYRRPGTLVSSNTSGIPIHLMAAGRSEDFQRHFCGTHFFNPPRYMRLLEIIPTAMTSQEVVDFFMSFGDRILGKQTVLCKDTPGFIGNRIGVNAIASVFQLTTDLGLGIADVDALTGQAIGRPNTGTFRLGDLIGHDVSANVLTGLKQNCPDDEQAVQYHIPPYLQFLLDNKFLGNKSGAGFYKKTGEKDANGKPVVLALNLQTLTYEPAQKTNLPSLTVAKQIEELPQRLKTLFDMDDKGGELIRRHFAGVFSYSSLRVPEITEALYSVDDALRAGYNWELGPFQCWDAIGIGKGVEAAEAAGYAVAGWVKEMLAAGHTSFYQLKNGVQHYYDISQKQYLAVPGAEGFIVLNHLRDRAPVLKNSEMVLHDIGDGVLCLEFRSKVNAIGEGILRGLNESIQLAEEGEWKGLVIGNQATNFTVGANLMMIAMLAYQQEFDELNMAVNVFQQTSMRCRYSSIPVVATTQGYTFGGGTELLMHCDAAVCAAESYIGLVEAGVGLIPGGGGTKEFALRASDAFFEGDVQIPTLLERFKTIATASVATSAYEGYKYGYLIPIRDQVCMNTARNIGEAKQVVLQLADEYVQRQPRQDVLVLGRTGLASLYVAAHSLLLGGYASEHDIKIAKKTAFVLCGGDLTGPQRVSEQYLLDLEREAFLSLCGEQKTLERIQYMLTNNKPLRN